MGRSLGKVATAATTEVPVNATAYTEPTSGAQRALKSSSANDTAAGTGARTIRVTYYTLDAAGKITGPWVELVTLNGMTAVPMVATNLALVEKMEIVIAGSGGVAAGNIILTVDNAGAGATIASVAAGDVRTFLAHHYVPTGYQCRLSDVEGAGGDPAAAAFTLKVTRYAPTPTVEQPAIAPLLASSTASASQVLRDKATVIAGPARVRAYTTPANNSAQTGTAAFGFTDIFCGGWQLTP